MSSGPIECFLRRGRLQGRLQALREPPGHRGTLLGRAIVVLARRDVPRRAAEVQMEGVRPRLLARVPGEADEVATDAPLAVVALRVGRVIAEHRDQIVTVPQAQHADEGVNNAFGGRLDLRVLDAAPADVQHLTVGAEHPAVRRDAIDPGLSESQMRDRRRMRQRRAERLGRTLDRLLGKVRVEPFPRQTARGHQRFGIRVESGGVVLVQAMNRHAIGRGPRGLRQRLSPGVMSAVADPDPVQRAQDDRLLLAQQDDSPTTEPIHDLPGRFDRPLAERTPQRRGRVHLERRDPQRRLVREGIPHPRYGKAQDRQNQQVASSHGRSPYDGTFPESFAPALAEATMSATASPGFASRWNQLRWLIRRETSGSLVPVMKIAKDRPSKGQEVCHRYPQDSDSILPGRLDRAGGAGDFRPAVAGTGAASRREAGPAHAGDPAASGSRVVPARRARIDPLLLRS